MLQNLNMKTVSIVSGVGVAAMGGMYVLQKMGYLSGSSSSDKSPGEVLMEKMIKAEEDQQRNPNYPFLSPSEAVALDTDDTLSDFVSRITQYSKINEELVHHFGRVAAEAAEYLVRIDEVQRKKSIPVVFGAYTRSLVMTCRNMRKSIREESPSMLEEFDEFVEEVIQYKNDNHHNMWCDAHS